MYFSWCRVAHKLRRPKSWFRGEYRYGETMKRNFHSALVQSSAGKENRVFGVSGRVELDFGIPESTVNRPFAREINSIIISII